MVACFAGIMGDFAWWPLVKQVKPVGGTVPRSIVVPPTGEGGQLVIEVGHIVKVAKVTPAFLPLFWLRESG